MARRPGPRLAAKRNLPSGSKLKALVTASFGTCPIADNRPVDSSTVKAPMRLWPRSEGNKNILEAVI